MPFLFAQTGKIIFTSGDNFMRVSLMADIPDNFILRSIENIMKGQS